LCPLDDADEQPRTSTVMKRYEVAADLDAAYELEPGCGFGERLPTRTQPDACSGNGYEPEPGPDAYSANGCGPASDFVRLFFVTAKGLEGDQAISKQRDDIPTESTEVPASKPRSQALS
jgi:hypothetical protein